MTDIEKYLISKKIPQSYIKYHKNNVSPIISDDRTGGYIDVFTKLLDDRILFLSGEIDDMLCDILKAQLLYLEQLDPNKDISLYINSPGGSVYDGLSLVDTMEYIKPNICTINTGLAASMGAIILCSGSKGKRKSLKRSRVMIHQPMSFLGNYLQAIEIEIEAKEINHLKKELYTIISENTGQEYNKVLKDGDRDYWLSAKDAKDYGIIDEIIYKRK
jgi:ATP-dependent Clp protease protease subunit